MWQRTTSFVPQQCRRITATAFLSTPLLVSFLKNKHSIGSSLHSFMYTWYPPCKVIVVEKEAIAPDHLKNKDFAHVLAYK